MNHSLPLSGPSSLSLGNPVGTGGPELGLKNNVGNKSGMNLDLDTTTGVMGITEKSAVKRHTYRHIQMQTDTQTERSSPDRKKVSCWSLAGCCWGWKRESKFQKELSMKLLVGISVKLQRAQEILGL